MLFLSDCCTEKFIKKLGGRKDVADIEDALLRLDMLTKEEGLKVLVENLEVIRHVDGVVNVVNENVEANKVLTENINRNVEATKTCIHGIDSNMKVTNVLIDDIDTNVHKVDNGTLHLPSVFHANRPLFPSST
jgi:hypothetical protein